VIDECGGVIPAFKQTLPAYTKLRFTKLATQLIKDRLLKYEDQIVRTVYKFGVLFCKEGQTEEDDMYNNGTLQPLPRLPSPLLFCYAVDGYVKLVAEDPVLVFSPWQPRL
jgi:hypothetical protein